MNENRENRNAPPPSDEELSRRLREKRVNSFSLNIAEDDFAAPEEAEEFVPRQAFEYHFYPEEYEKEYSSTGRTLPLDRETDYQFRIEAECASGTMEIRVTCGTEEQIYAGSPSEPCRATVSVESGAAEETQFDIEIQPDTEGGVRVEVLTCP